MENKVTVIDLGGNQYESNIIDTGQLNKTQKGMEKLDLQAKNLQKHMKDLDKVMTKAVQANQKLGAEAAVQMKGACREAQVMEKRMAGIRNASQKAMQAVTGLGRAGWKQLQKMSSLPDKVWGAMTKPVKSVIGQIQKGKRALAGLFQGTAVQGLIIKPLQEEIQSKRREAPLRALLGQGTDNRVQELDKMSQWTSFDRDELYEGDRMLEIMTNGALSTGNGLRLVGDIAAGTGQSFTEVSQVMGGLYDAMAHGRPVEEMTGRLLQLGAISLQEKEKLEQLAASGQDMARIWPQAAVQLGRMSGQMEEQSDQLSNLLGGAKAVIKDTIWKRLGAGLGDGLKPALERLRQWMQESQALLDRVGQAVQRVAQEVASRVAGLLEDAARKVQEAVQSDAFQNADFFGKVQILWDDIIGGPLSAWWENSGKQRVNDLADKLGQTLGGFFKNGILGLFGLELEGVAEDGASLGLTFAQSFLQGFQPEKVWEAVKRALGRMLKSAGKLLPGGQAPDALSYLSIFGLGQGVLKLGKVASPLVKGASSMGKALLGTGAAGGAGASAAGASAAGLLLPASALFAGLGLLEAFQDFRKAANTANEKERSVAVWSGVARTGMVGAGAAIGTMVLPGLGTAVGAGLGGLVSLFAGGKIGKGFSDWLDGSGKVRKAAVGLQEASQEYAALAERQEEVSGLTSTIRDLNEKIQSGKLPADELAKSQGKLQEAMNRLHQLYPDLIDQSDLENTSLEAKLGLINDINQVKLEQAKGEVRLAVARFEQELPILEKNLTEEQERATAHQAKGDAAMAEAQMWNSYIEQMKALEGDTEAQAELQQKIQKDTGYAYIHAEDFEELKMLALDTAEQEYLAETQSRNLVQQREQEAQSGYDNLVLAAQLDYGVDLKALRQQMQEAQALKEALDQPGALEGNAWDQANQKYAELTGRIQEAQDKIVPLMDEIGEINEKFNFFANLKPIDVAFYARYYGFDQPSLFILRGDTGGDYVPSGNTAWSQSATSGGYATGTSWATPGLHWVGENGPELLRFRGGEQVYNASDSWKIAQSLDRRPSAAAAAPLQISLGGIKVEVSASGDGSNVAAAIEKQLPGLANELCAEVAQKLTKIYANMPLTVEG